MSLVFLTNDLIFLTTALAFSTNDPDFLLLMTTFSLLMTSFFHTYATYKPKNFINCCHQLHHNNYYMFFIPYYYWPLYHLISVRYITCLYSSCFRINLFIFENPFIVIYMPLSYCQIYVISDSEWIMITFSLTVNHMFLSDSNAMDVYILFVSMHLEI